ncbi:splicing factor, Prp19-binding domain-containing protein [Vararia minispora EC-137]|uniref:Splicing factor, Prp19-binding domain-containing protein n=1 Tax=Vararia minispora EC-137 TaxID=1314806 RepID=A0ACB8QTP1_9AGAM|nr:splicing factor, Prp19-binding domain-containing protein [Vararia minispora EC-137]
MSTAAPRKQAPRPLKPVGRYWKGKAPKGATDLPSSDEEDEEDVEAQGLPEEEGDEVLVGEQDFLSGAVVADEEEDGGATGRAKKLNIALRDVEISKDGRVKVGGMEAGEEEESEESEEESEEEEKAGESEEEARRILEYESGSEEEKPKLQFRPVFVPKRARATIAEREAEAQDTEDALNKKEREAEERKKQSHDMVAESIRRELAEKEKEDEVPDVDDTDGLEPQAEFDAWRLRELARIKRDKEAEIAREQEREEIERRRALPEEQRLKEDLEHAEKLRAEKPKGQQKFLQKYWHKGAFHQDDEIMKRHDYTEATESTIDVSALPKVMQVKNFGKRSRTKYTHLLDQDTTAGNGGFGGTGPVKSGGKDCPQSTGIPPGRPGTGANATGRGFRDDKPGVMNADEVAVEVESDERAAVIHHRMITGTDDGTDMKTGEGGILEKFFRHRTTMTVPSNEPKPRERRTIKVAIVGSGLAGLSAAYLLSTLRTRTDVEFNEGGGVDFEVHIFEKATTLGMDSHSASLALPSVPDKEWRVDVPMRAFQGGYYPQLIRLYSHLGVAFRKADFSYSFTKLSSLPEGTSAKSLDLHPHFLYEGASGKRGISTPSSRRLKVPEEASPIRRAFSQIGMSVHHALWTFLMLCLWLRLVILCAPLFRPKDIKEITWEEWVERHIPCGPISRWTGFAAAWNSFVEDLCVPMFSGICSATREDVLQHPAEEFLDFNWKTLGTHHYLVSNGIREVVSRLSAHISTEQIHLGMPTTAILPDPSGSGLVSVVCIPSDGQTTRYDGFSHVIFATQAKYAAPLLRGYAEKLSGEARARAAELGACLARVLYRESVVINHTDAKFLPTDSHDRRDLNVVTVASPAPTPNNGRLDPNAIVVPSSYSMATQRLMRPAHVPQFIGADGEEEGIYQTTNPIIAPDGGRILSVGRLERALLTIDGKNATRMLYRTGGKGVGKLQGAARRAEGAKAAGLWVVGSYAYYGIPMLEGCVVMSEHNSMYSGYFMDSKITP